MPSYTKLISERYPDVILRVVPGHFVTPNTHVNYYLDMTPMKARMTEARAVAKALSEAHYYTTAVDTILCLDGMEIVGAYLAEELTKAGIVSMNMHKSPYVMAPEYSASGQIIFRENTVGWVRGKNVLLLFGSVTSGKTVIKTVEALKYYGAQISGISSIFSMADKIGGMQVQTLFSRSDLPAYESYEPEYCVMCRNAQKVDALCSGLGYTRI